MLTRPELDTLIEDIRRQASTWLGDEASEKIERLIAHTIFLRKSHDAIQAKLLNGYRLVQTGADTTQS